MSRVYPVVSFLILILVGGTISIIVALHFKTKNEKAGQIEFCWRKLLGPMINDKKNLSMSSLRYARHYHYWWPWWQYWANNNSSYWYCTKVPYYPFVFFSSMYCRQIITCVVYLHKGSTSLRLLQSSLTFVSHMNRVWTKQKWMQETKGTHVERFHVAG